MSPRSRFVSSAHRVFVLCLAFPAMMLSLPTLAGSGIPFRDDKQGPTCAYFNSFSKLAWPGRPGMYAGEPADGLDKQRLSAPVAFSVGDQQLFVSADVSDFVRESLADKLGGVELVMLLTSGSGVLELHARESQSTLMRPRLRIFLKDRREISIEPRADTYLACGSHSPQGAEHRIRVGPDFRALVGFDLPANSLDFERAEVEFAVLKMYGKGRVQVGRLFSFHDVETAPVEQGISAAFAGDAGIEAHPDVLFVERFDGTSWDRRWSYRSISSSRAEPVSSDPALGFAPLDGAALRVEIPADGQTGLDLRYGFKDKLGAEPEEVYFRYYLRFASDWHPTVEGGKLPGFGGTYGDAGWGQRRANGRNGWSARGFFTSHPPGSDPKGTPTGIGSYVYHVEMQSAYSGDAWPWGHIKASLSNNRWYSVEQYLKLNRPGYSDGSIKAWVDGVSIFKKKGIDFRHVSDLKIEQIWMNVYHGGMSTPGKDLHLYIDNVIVAKRYIGPMTSGKPVP